MEKPNDLFKEAVELLKDLIRTPSLSGEEQDTADVIGKFLTKSNIPFQRGGNNIWAFSQHFDLHKPSILLNSHHDTVKPNASYTNDPFKAIVEGDKLFGLGSNDAGGCLVSLIAVFKYFYDQEMPYNLVLVASAEEEISGKNGVSAILSEMPQIELAIVGEPTQMQLAVAEKGLMVIDAMLTGKSGHAAREEGENALYKALPDLQKIVTFQFKKESPFLGKSKVSATVIQAGTQHNVVPDTCTFTLDVRITDAYTLEDALEELQDALEAELKPRSMRLQPSKIADDHAIFEIAKQLKLPTFGSATLSDQALLPFDSIKIGPGDSARSHTADEYIYIHEIEEGIEGYIKLLDAYFEHRK